jgi:two-component system cell cycle sensor histidine kinase/response regulator CckA
MTTPENVPALLLIDDDKTVRSLLLTLLSRCGYRVVAAAGGEEAIALYRDLHEIVSLVLLDVQMPGMDGPTTLRELRKFNPDVRCLLMTGDPGEVTDEQLHQAGVIALLAKPFAAAPFLEALSKAGAPPPRDFAAD